jgi:hypothetical protein
VTGVYTGGKTGTNAFIYVNGALVKNGTIASTPEYSSNYYVGIGKVAAMASNAYFKGTLDNVQVYNRPLSAQEVAALYNAQTNILASEELQAGDVWSACVTPNDGRDDGATVCSNTVTINASEATPPIVPPVPEFGSWALIAALGIIALGLARLRGNR